MLKFHIIIIKFSIFTNKNSQCDTFFPKLKNTIVKIDIKSFSVWLKELIFQLKIKSARLTKSVPHNFIILCTYFTQCNSLQY